MSRPRKLAGVAGAVVMWAAAAIASPGTPAVEQDRDPGPADLSICKTKPAVYPTAEANIREFAELLNGTWLLNTRTIEGLTIETDSKFYFDLGTITDGEARGSALMLDKGNLKILDPLEGCKACEADAAMGALWQVQIKATEDRQIVLLSMAGDYLGSYGDFRKGVRATETAAFAKNNTSYLAGHLVSPAGGQGMPDDVWDRIGLTRDTLTYVSCTGGFVDRFEKLSNDKPIVDGLSLAETWRKAKKDGWLLKPPPVRRSARQSDR